MKLLLQLCNRSALLCVQGVETCCIGMFIQCLGQESVIRLLGIAGRSSLKIMNQNMVPLLPQASAAPCGVSTPAEPPAVSPGAAWAQWNLRWDLASSNLCFCIWLFFLFTASCKV